MKGDFDVIVVGAGVVGTVMAALALEREIAAPGRVAIVADRLGAVAAIGRDWDLRVYALGRASQRLLEHCAIWQSLPADRVFAYERMCVWDATGAPNAQGSLTFDSAELGEPNLGFIVDGRTLAEHALAAARAAGAVLIEASVESATINETHARVVLRDGRALSARLLIAADGTESRVREILGIGIAGHAYHAEALVAHVRTAKPHRNTAWQRFLPTGPLAFLPLPDGRSSIVWSVERGAAQRFLAQDATQFSNSLTAASAAALGEVELASAVASFPLKLQYADDYARPRAVLIGDAAHAVHPLAGQGLNLGLLDAAALAESLQPARGGKDPGEYRLLRQYERRRRSENLMSAAAFDGLERLFSNGNPLLKRLRATGLSAVERLPVVKRQLAERALGFAGDTPAFLKAGRASLRK